MPSAPDVSLVIPLLDEAESLPELADADLRAEDVRVVGLADDRIELASKAVLQFGLLGIEAAMNNFNKR